MAALINNKTTDDAVKSRPLLVYLDNADLVNIADGRAVDIDALRHAFDVSGAKLLISPIHLIDVGESTLCTKQRWIDATARLAPLRFATEPGVDVPLDPDGLAQLVAASVSDISVVRSVFMLKQNAEETSRTAMLGNTPSGLSTKRLREIVEAIIDGNHERFAHLDQAMVQQVFASISPVLSMLETQHVDKAPILDALFFDAEGAVAAGSLPDLVRLRRR